MTICSWTLQQRLVRETGFKNLKIAVTFAVLQSLGTIPVSKLRWKIAVNIGAISLAISFKILAGSRSGPVAFWGLSLSSSLKTLSLVTNISGMAGKGWSSAVGINFNFHEDTCPNPLGRHHRQGFKFVHVRGQTVQTRLTR